MQPSGMTRQQRHTATPSAPYGYNRQGIARTQPRGTGAKKVFSAINIPLLIKGWVDQHRANVKARNAPPPPTQPIKLQHNIEGYD